MKRTENNLMILYMKIPLLLIRIVQAASFTVQQLNKIIRMQGYPNKKKSQGILAEHLKKIVLKARLCQQSTINQSIFVLFQVQT